MDGGARWAWKWRKAPDFILSLGYIEQYIGLKILNINDYLAYTWQKRNCTLMILTHF
jgi:hypothetical protein